MKGKRAIRLVPAVGVLMVLLLLAGCGLFDSSAQSIDPPPASVEEAMLKTASGESVPTGDRLEAVYLSDQNGLLAPVSLPIAPGDSAANAKTALEMLVKGGPFSGIIPEGFQGILPQGTEVESVSIDQDSKVAVVEFNSSFLNYPAQDERKMLEALTWTLTERPDVQSVQVWVDGRKLNEMPVNGTPTDRLLTRALGINLELGNGVSAMSSSPVTVYFSAASPAGVAYYVPVTRLVQSGPDKLSSALTELIHGPQSKQGLNQVLTGQTKLESVKKTEDGVVSVAITDDMFELGEIVPAEFLQSIVLTAADNVGGTAKIRIELNGQKTVMGEDNQNYGLPVARPEHINEIPI